LFLVYNLHLLYIFSNYFGYFHFIYNSYFVISNFISLNPFKSNTGNLSLSILPNQVNQTTFIHSNLFSWTVNPFKSVQPNTIEILYFWITDFEKVMNHHCNQLKPPLTFIEFSNSYIYIFPSEVKKKTLVKKIITSWKVLLDKILHLRLCLGVTIIFLK